MKFSLFFICFSSLGAKQSFVTATECKPFMYFDGQDWKSRTPNRYSATTGSEQLDLDFNSFKTINTRTVFDNIDFGECDVHGEAEKNVKLNQETKAVHNVTGSKSKISLKQVLNFMEPRDKDPTEYFSMDPEAWIHLLFSISNSLREIAIKANESYYMLKQHAKPNSNTEVWRSTQRNERVNNNPNDLMGFILEDTTNEISNGEINNNLELSNGEYINKIFSVLANKPGNNQYAKVKEDQYKRLIDPGHIVTRKGKEIVSTKSKIKRQKRER